MVSYLGIVKLKWTIEAWDKDDCSSLSAIELCLKEEVSTKAWILNGDVRTVLYPDHGLQCVLIINDWLDRSYRELGLIVEKLCVCEVVLGCSEGLRIIKKAEFRQTHSNDPFYCVLSVLSEVLSKDFNSRNTSKLYKSLAVPSIVPIVPVPSELQLL